MCRLSGIACFLSLEKQKKKKTCHPTEPFTLLHFCCSAGVFCVIWLLPLPMPMATRPCSVHVYIMVCPGLCRSALCSQSESERHYNQRRILNMLASCARVCCYNTHTSQFMLIVQRANKNRCDAMEESENDCNRRGCKVAIVLINRRMDFNSLSIEPADV